MIVDALLSRETRPRCSENISEEGQGSMALDILKERGIPLDRQQFDWVDLVRTPLSKLDDDAFTRVRIILVNGIELEAVRFQHSFARMNGDLRRLLADIRRVEHHQATLVNWLLPADQSSLETTLGYEQVAIEVTASVAMHEPDPYPAQVYRFGMLEDFDHLYRYSALIDRLEGKDPNTITQSYTDITAGRPTREEHRAPQDDLRDPYDRLTADPITKLNALTIMAAEQQTHNYYMNIGPTFADPVARMLYAEIASIEEQHVTQYESIIDPRETWLENEELAHVELLRSALEELGADPTATTPGADVIGVASMGLLQVVADPRTTLPQCLDALLTAELTDNDGWQTLIALGRALGKDDLVVEFERAKAAEAVHLAEVRRWLSVEAALEVTRALAA